MDQATGSAGFQTACVADFQIGESSAHHASFGKRQHPGGVETRDTAGLENCATRPSHGWHLALAWAPGSEKTTMNPEADSTSVEFWERRFRAGRMPWDLGGVPEALGQFLATASAKGRVLIPGCGSGYEVRAFVEAGWDTIAVDFSPAAVERARQMLGPLGDRVVLGDFFAHDFGVARFDLAYERTFLCSLPKRLWPDYKRRLAELVPPGGRLLGVFFYGHDDDPPPYGMTETEASALFGPEFALTVDAPVLDSLPVFQGKERWQIWERR